MFSESLERRDLARRSIKVGLPSRKKKIGRTVAGQHVIPGH